MGSASTIALGIALARPERKVIIVDGDGSLLMQLGSLVTIAGAAPPNLFHFVFENGVYETSGSQPLPAEGRFDLTGMARAAGYAHTAQFDDAGRFASALPELVAAARTGVRVGAHRTGGWLPGALLGRHPTGRADARVAQAAGGRNEDHRISESDRQQPGRQSAGGRPAGAQRHARVRHARAAAPTRALVGVGRHVLRRRADRRRSRRRSTPWPS